MNTDTPARQKEKKIDRHKYVSASFRLPSFLLLGDKENVMDTKKCFIRDGLEIFNPEEVEQIEQVSNQQLQRDLNRAQTWIACGDYEKASRIIKPLEGRV